MKIKCLIIDDEPLAVDVVKNYLNNLEQFEVVETFTNAVQAFNFMKDNVIDLIFLDINMPVLDGLNFLRSLEDKPLVIITTAHREYAADTYELDVLDYLVKPISFPRFMKSIDRVHHAISDNKSTLTSEAKPRSFIFLRISKKKMRKVFIDEILVIESLKDYIKVITTTERYIVHQTLTSFTDQLPSDQFLRIHRSYTIALDKITAIDGNTIEIDGARYMIGRTYNEEVKERINKAAIN